VSRVCLGLRERVSHASAAEGRGRRGRAGSGRSCPPGRPLRGQPRAGSSPSRSPGAASRSPGRDYWL